MVFEKLEKIAEIEVEYTAKSALAIQAGREHSLTAVDQPVVRIGGQPVIPGSTLKGALRSILESVLTENGKKVCIPEAAIPREYMRDRRGYAESLGRIEPCDGTKENVCCSVCQIFGAASMAGRASFLDAKPTSEVPMKERTHVALRRDTKAAAEGRLMELEAVDAGAKFKGIIRIINPENWHVGAIINVIEKLELMGLGSKKTAGYGEIVTNILGINLRELTNGEWKETARSADDFKSTFTAYLKER